MNTKQKLTLGIAAIFMVTLTIVGVTYAYFVTQVSGDTQTDIDVQTATFGSVKYVPGNNLGENDQPINTVLLSDVLPGTEAATKTFKFAVTNELPEGADAAESSFYDLILENTEDFSKGAFLQTVADENPATAIDTTSECYFGTAGETEDYPENVTVGNVPGACTGGAYYDNVYVTIVRYTDEGYSDVDDTFTYAEQRLSSEAIVDVLSNIEIAAGDTHYYTLTVEYKDAEANQNYETEAVLTIRPNID